MDEPGGRLKETTSWMVGTSIDLFAYLFYLLVRYEMGMRHGMNPGVGPLKETTSWMVQSTSKLSSPKEFQRCPFGFQLTPKIHQKRYLNKA